MDVKFNMDADVNELYHYGRKGMKWYQKIFTKDTAKATANKRKKNAEKARKAKAKKKEEELKKAKQEENAKKAREQEKAEVLKSRSAKRLFERADLFTDKELQEAYNRLILEKNIKSLAPDEVSKGEEYAKKFIKTSDTINGMLKSGSGLYDTVAKIVNGITGEKSLPILNADDRLKDANARKAELEAKKAKAPKKKDPEDPDVRRLRKAQADKAEEDARKARIEADAAKVKADEDKDKKKDD